jgi:hypothetical protein
MMLAGAGIFLAMLLDECGNFIFFSGFFEVHIAFDCNSLWW